MQRVSLCIEWLNSFDFGTDSELSYITSWLVVLCYSRCFRFAIDSYWLVFNPYRNRLTRYFWNLHVLANYIGIYNFITSIIRVCLSCAPIHCILFNHSFNYSNIFLCYIIFFLKNTLFKDFVFFRTLCFDDFIKLLVIIFHYKMLC